MVRIYLDFDRKTRAEFHLLLQQARQGKVAIAWVPASLSENDGYQEEKPIYANIEMTDHPLCTLAKTVAKTSPYTVLGKDGKEYYYELECDPGEILAAAKAAGIAAHL